MSAITRRSRSESITVTDADTAIALFRHDFLNNYTVTEITPALINRAMQLAESHALRGYDAAQLAAAIEVNAYGLSFGIPKLILVSADSNLNAAAMAEGLNVDNPNAHP
ncbi:MAG: type II toxin-antitoxin system VapC family toxin [Blastocatellia bacterium]